MGDHVVQGDCRRCNWWSGRTEAPARGGPSVESVIRHDVSKKAGRDSDFIIAVCVLLLIIIDVLNDILLWCRGLGDRWCGLEVLILDGQLHRRNECAKYVGPERMPCRF